MKGFTRAKNLSDFNYPKKKIEFKADQTLFHRI